ncbi:MAG: hypoxanthine phosphoribosyltransferase [Chloroflexi bacterium]|nr:hypoxanthine phosphoribosyltransferase [Chloroflexota bacterium]MBT7081149.1 hypoxanthine phosphoribosyltransferase [Chloroflexota bacterium]MBT7289426.1 hypoxanthine phosphoribosyltransferase [Chloroflexota bacterium]
MASAKVRDYYKLVRRVTAELHAESTLEHFSATAIRGIARSMDGSASLLLLDSTGKKLVHSTSWKLPQFYLKKGVLDAQKSIAEIVKRQPIIVPSVRRSKRMQYREQALEAGFASVLGVPIMNGSSPVGTIRVYLKEHREFTNNEVEFVSTMASLVSLALEKQTWLNQTKDMAAIEPVEPKQLPKLKKVKFVHPSEEEFASILDFYNIEWVYEPRAFPLNWEGQRVTQMFTPDFYLPRYDLYVELTTMKQRSVTLKNKKLRRLRQLYPGTKITLLYKKDFERMLARFGYEPMAQAKGHGVGEVLFSADQIQRRVSSLAKQVSEDYEGKVPLLVGVLRGVICFMADLIRNMSIPLNVDVMSLSSYASDRGEVVKITKDLAMDVVGRHVIMVEDIIDTGITLNYLLNHLWLKKPASLAVCTLLDKKARRLLDTPLDYVGFEVPDQFVIGYGLDYKEEYRNLPFIGVLE